MPQAMQRASCRNSGKKRNLEAMEYNYGPFLHWLLSRTCRDKHLAALLRHNFIYLLQQMHDRFEPWVEMIRSFFTVPNLPLETFITDSKLNCFFFSALPVFEFCGRLFLPVTQLPSQSNIIFSESVNCCTKADIWMSPWLHEVNKAHQPKGILCTFNDIVHTDLLNRQLPGPFWSRRSSSRACHFGASALRLPSRMPPFPFFSCLASSARLRFFARPVLRSCIRFKNFESTHILISNAPQTLHMRLQRCIRTTIYKLDDLPDLIDASKSLALGQSCVFHPIARFLKCVEAGKVN